MQHERKNDQRHHALDYYVNIEPVVLILFEQFLDLAQPEHLRQTEESQHLQSLEF